MTEKQIPKPPKNSDKTPGWAKDSKAKQEEHAWSDEAKLKKRRTDNKLGFLRVVGWIAPLVMIILSLVFIGSFVSWSLHLLLPKEFQWLATEQLSKIQSIIFSGSMGAIVASYLKKQVD